MPCHIAAPLVEFVMFLIECLLAFFSADDGKRGRR